ncbi:hypothetical protein [Bacillus sp. XF8]|uniref:CDI toxin immunity protein n=1 Tax=Bacillus sp. XF8 TaxID=2819289 RepID=UPI001FB6D915|nr:hypothetical protein [Bacillus sp. XF8]
MNKNQRAQRLSELLEANKKKHKPTYGALYEECTCMLGVETKELSLEKGEEIYTLLSESYPFEWWGRIAWNKVALQCTVASIDKINQFIPLTSKVYILWSTGPAPVLYADLKDVLRNIDDVTAVGSDTYLFCPNNFVIEFYHEGEIIIGFEKKHI